MVLPSCEPFRACIRAFRDSKLFMWLSVRDPAIVTLVRFQTPKCMLKVSNEPQEAPEAQKKASNRKEDAA